MSNIKRIESLEEYPSADPQFVSRHTAFAANQSIISFEILNPEQAIIHCDKNIPENTTLLEEIIQEFRFYSYHITRFLDEQHQLLKSFPPVKLTLAEIDSLQPSQFYVNQEKIAQCSGWIEDICHLIIPVYPNTNFICDGHTRLYAALQKGFRHCYIYTAEESDDCILDFVQMARKRNIFRVADLQKLSDQDYKTLWWQFCDNYFAQKN